MTPPVDRSILAKEIESLANSLMETDNNAEGDSPAVDVVNDSLHVDKQEKLSFSNTAYPKPISSATGYSMLELSTSAAAAIEDSASNIINEMWVPLLILLNQSEALFLFCNFHFMRSEAFIAIYLYPFSLSAYLGHNQNQWNVSIYLIFWKKNVLTN